MTRGIILLGLAMLMAVPALADNGSDEKTPRWGAGWLGLEQAPTVRFRIGRTEIGLAARPDDYIYYRESWESDWETGQVDSVRNVDDDDKRESGWVRLDAAIPVKQWDTVTLPVLVGFSYSWSDQQNYAKYWSGDSQGYRTIRTDKFINSYALVLGLRPTWHIRSWVALELEFGVRFRWSNYDEERIETHPDAEFDNHDWNEGNSKSFEKFGPYGGSSLGMFNLVFWF